MGANSPAMTRESKETLMCRPSQRSKVACVCVAEFMEQYIYPHEASTSAKSTRRRTAGMNELKAKSKVAGLCNMLQRHYPNPLTNLEYAPVCEIMGCLPIRPSASTACARYREHGNADPLRNRRAS